MLIDIHVHLLGLNPSNRCFVGGKLARPGVATLLTRSLGLSGVARHEIDDAYADLLIHWARTSSLDAVGVLAFDGVYDAAGKLDRERTALYVDNDYCLQVCGEDERLLPICSINPQRADAMVELERVVAAGAVAIKTLPNSMGFDPLNPTYRPFWRRMAQLKIPLLTHTSFEHTVPPIDQAFGLPERLTGALQEGVKVIAAHCASSGLAHPIREDFYTWQKMLRTFDNLYGDISAMASVSRGNYIHKVLADRLSTERVALGSDYPIPVSPAIFARRLGFKEAMALSREHNPLERNLRTFRALGVGQDVMERGAKLLRL
jgi:predicted TIM-barrel fold metal-dependent hydrolase